MAVLFKVKVKYIYIYPLGGISKFYMDLNISSLKELLILLFGPLFQFFAYYLLLIIFPTKQEMIKIYHFGILYFNLLPIYPLDGGKIIKLFLERIIPYKKSLQIIIQVSYIIILILLFFFRKEMLINQIVILLLLLFLIRKEENKINYIYEKFLLERYLKNYTFPKKKIIYNENQFYREKTHIIKVLDTYYLEKDYLAKKYHKLKKSY